MRAVIATEWGEMMSQPVDLPVRVVALSLLTLCLIAGSISAARWLQGGVDGILSQRATAAGFEIRQLRPGAAADLAGLRAGDVIVARDSVPALDRSAYWDARRHGHGGDVVVLAVRPAGTTAAVDRRLALTPILSIPDQLALLGVLILVQVLVPLTATLVLIARPRDFVARLFFIAGIANTIGTTLFMWDKAVGTTVDPVWHWYAFVLPRWFAALAYTHLLFLFPAVHPWFVRPRRPGWRTARWLGAIAAVYGPLGVAGYVVADSFPSTSDLGALVPPQAEISRLMEYAIPPWLLTLVALAYGYRHAKGVAARAAVWWLVVAIVFRAIATTWGTQTAQAVTGARVEPVSQSFAAIAVLVVYAGVAVALVRYRLFEVSPFVRRAIVYPLAIALLVGAYDLFADVIARGLAALLGPDLAASPVIEALPVLVILSLLRPVRRRLEALLDRRLDRPRWAVESFAAEAETTLSMTGTTSVENLLTTDAAARLGLRGAWLVLNPSSSDGEAATGRASVGARIPLSVAISGQPDREVGVWILGLRVNGDPFDEPELGVLTRLGHLAALRLDHEHLLAEAFARGSSDI